MKRMYTKKQLHEIFSEPDFSVNGSLTENFITSASTPFIRAEIRNGILYVVASARIKNVSEIAAGATVTICSYTIPEEYMDHIVPLADVEVSVGTVRNISTVMTADLLKNFIRVKKASSTELEFQFVNMDTNPVPANSFMQMAVSTFFIL